LASSRKIRVSGGASWKKRRPTPVAETSRTRQGYSPLWHTTLAVRSISEERGALRSSAGSGVVSVWFGMARLVVRVRRIMENEV